MSSQSTNTDVEKPCIHEEEWRPHILAGIREIDVPTLDRHVIMTFYAACRLLMSLFPQLPADVETKIRSYCTPYAPRSKKENSIFYVFFPAPAQYIWWDTPGYKYSERNTLCHFCGAHWLCNNHYTDHYYSTHRQKIVSGYCRVCLEVNGQEDVPGQFKCFQCKALEEEVCLFHQPRDSLWKYYSSIVHTLGLGGDAPKRFLRNPPLCLDLFCNLLLEDRKRAPLPWFHQDRAKRALTFQDIKTIDLTTEDEGEDENEEEVILLPPCKIKKEKL